MVQYVSTVDPLVRLDAESFHHLVMGEIALAERQQAVAVAEFRQSQGVPNLWSSGVGPGLRRLGDGGFRDCRL